MFLVSLLSLFNDLIDQDYCNDCRVFIESNFQDNAFNRRHHTIMANEWTRMLKETCRENVKDNACNFIFDHTFTDFFEGLYVDHDDFCFSAGICSENSTDKVEPTNRCDSCIDITTDLIDINELDKANYLSLFETVSGKICAGMVGDYLKGQCTALMEKMGPVSMEQLLTYDSPKEFCIDASMCKEEQNSTEDKKLRFN